MLGFDIFMLGAVGGKCASIIYLLKRALAFSCSLVKLRARKIEREREERDIDVRGVSIYDILKFIGFFGPHTLLSAKFMYRETHQVVPKPSIQGQ